MRLFIAVARLIPWLSEELPRISLGTRMPKRHPTNMPMAWHHSGEVSYSVKSLMIIPQKVPRNAPKKSD